MLNTAVDLFQYADVFKENHINGRRPVFPFINSLIQFRPLFKIPLCFPGVMGYDISVVLFSICMSLSVMQNKKLFFSNRTTKKWCFLFIPLQVTLGYNLGP